MKIFVGCSSRDTKNKEYITCAEQIGRFINDENHILIFGGCKTGLMGIIYSQITSPCKQVKIVMAKAYEHQLKNLSYCSPIYFSNTVNERKSKFTTLADVLVFIPGGIGTLDEFFSTLESKRAHEHNLPILIVNINGYFTPLLHMFDNIYSENFADISNSSLYTVFDSTESTIEYLSNFHK